MYTAYSANLYQALTNVRHQNIQSPWCPNNLWHPEFQTYVVYAQIFLPLPDKSWVNKHFHSKQLIHAINSLPTKISLA